MLYHRLKSRWKSFDQLEAVLCDKYKNKEFNADILLKHYPAESKDFINNHLRWMASVDVIGKLTVRIDRKIRYQLGSRNKLDM